MKTRRRKRKGREGGNEGVNLGWVAENTKSIGKNHPWRGERGERERRS